MKLNLNPRVWIAGVAILVSLPVLAQTANFGSLTLALGFDSSIKSVTGHTGGGYSLSSIANKDQKNNPCIGFADTTPDHIIVLENNFPRLTLQIDSGGNDTTLLIKYPNGQIRCGDDTGSSKDASISEQNWPQGSYSIWVGSFDANQRWNYRLFAQEID